MKQETIARLQATKDHDATQNAEAGAAAGKAWAQDSASHAELKRLAAAQAENDDHTVAADSAWTPADNLCRTIHGDKGDDMGRNDLHAWIEEIADIPQDMASDPDYVNAFAAAAVEVYDEFETENA